MATPPPIETAKAPSTPKPIHSLVLDTGPLIKNDPPASVLLAQADQLYTLPSIIPEIRDSATRSRVETTLLPFVSLRSPRPESIRFVASFARKTGDLAVLSRPDREVLALGYELECERNGGDWRLRNSPGQKRLNGRPAQSTAAPSEQESAGDSQQADGAGTEHNEAKTEEETLNSDLDRLKLEADGSDRESPNDGQREPRDESEAQEELQPAVEGAGASLDNGATDETASREEDAEGLDDDDDGGWITPSNLNKQKAHDVGAAVPSQPLQKTLQAAILTSDYAMQNVALRMNLNLVTPSLARITHIKNWVLRCHGCFHITRDMEKQFCPSCGQPTLNRTSCSVDDHGNFKLHLKKNFQWNNHGNVYSVPKAVAGSASGKLPRNVGGKNGWGRDLVLAEDQKEYVRASAEQRRAKKKDLMDDDYLPDILSGERRGQGGRLRVGAGRNVNARRKH